LPVGVEEADNAFGPLERLDQPIQEDPIKATIMPANAALVVFVKGVHQRPPADPTSAGHCR
jgi:hypothetical protein